MGACVSMITEPNTATRYFLKLRGAVTENGHTLKTLAKHLGITPQALNKKMYGRSDFTLSEVFRICTLLNKNIDIFLESNLYDLKFLDTLNQ